MAPSSTFADRIGAGERQSDYHRKVGTTDPRVVIREDTGRPGGTQVHHWSDRVDAIIGQLPDGRRPGIDQVRVTVRFSDHGYNRSDWREFIQILARRQAARLPGAPKPGQVRARFTPSDSGLYSPDVPKRVLTPRGALP